MILRSDIILVKLHVMFVNHNPLIPLEILTYLLSISMVPTVNLHYHIFVLAFNLYIIYIYICVIFFPSLNIAFYSASCVCFIYIYLLYLSIFCS